MSICRSGFVLCIALLATALMTESVEAASIVLDDFEAGVGAWRTNDREAAGRHPSGIAMIYTVGRVVDGRTQQAALIEFTAARDTWASVSLPIDGTLWAQHNVGQISLWMRGDGSEGSVDLTLRSKLGEERVDVSYTYRLSLEGRDWQRRAIRLFAFEDAEGNPPTMDVIRNAYLLQFAKTGSWSSFNFYVDDIMAEPIPGAEGHALLPAGGPLAVRVDFTRTQARMLGQVGANLGGNVGLVLESPASAASIGRAVEQLTPSVIRLRLSDFYDPQIGDYDLIRLNRVINWVGETGARAQVCLNPALIPGEDGAEARLDPEFEEVAVRLVALRQGGPTVRYYELFDRPLLNGHFDSVQALVAAYNSFAARVIEADPEARVGGPGLGAAWETQVRGFLEGVQTLHFFSLQLFGAHNAEAPSEALIEAAATGAVSGLPDQLTLEQIRHLAHSVRRPMPELFVTSMALNSARGPDGSAADGRVVSNFGAAWTAAAVLQSSSYADKFLQYRLYDGGWGMLDDRGRAGPLFATAWLLRNYAPRGSTLCHMIRPAPDVLVAAVWTGTARNVLVVSAGDEPRSVIIEAWGVGSPRMVRERRLTSTGELGMFDRPNSHSQSIEFEGPGFSVIQFIGDD